MIDWTKPIETVDGRACRVLAKDVQDDNGRPIVVAVTEKDGSESVYQASLDGNFHAADPRPSLRNKPETKTVWLEWDWSRATGESFRVHESDPGKIDCTAIAKVTLTEGQFDR